MTYQDIYNLILASAPCITSVCVCLVTFFNLIRTLKQFEISNNKEIEELKKQNQCLQDACVSAQNSILELSQQTQKVIDKVNNEYEPKN